MDYVLKKVIIIFMKGIQFLTEYPRFTTKQLFF